MKISEQNIFFFTCSQIPYRRYKAFNYDLCKQDINSSICDMAPDAEMSDGLLVLLAAGAELLLGGEGQRLPGYLLPDEGLYLGADGGHGHVGVIM